MRPGAHSKTDGAGSGIDRAADAASIPRPMPAGPMPRTPAQHKLSNAPKLAEPRASRCSTRRIRGSVLATPPQAQPSPHGACMQLAWGHTCAMAVTLAVFQLATFWLKADADRNICTQEPYATQAHRCRALHRSDRAAGYAHFAYCSAAGVGCMRRGRVGTDRTQQVHPVAHPDATHPRPGRRNTAKQ